MKNLIIRIVGYPTAWRRPSRCAPNFRTGFHQRPALSYPDR